MRAFALAAALCACAVAPPAAPEATGRPARAAAPTTRLTLPSARDRDCADLVTRAAAQAALRSGDPDRLDADRDGIACERLRR